MKTYLCETQSIPARMGTPVLHRVYCPAMDCVKELFRFRILERPDSTAKWGIRYLSKSLNGTEIAIPASPKTRTGNQPCGETGLIRMQDHSLNLSLLEA
jgi:hypothetical protein